MSVFLLVYLFETSLQIAFLNVAGSKIEYNYIIICIPWSRTHFSSVLCFFFRVLFAQKPVANISIKGSSCVNTTNTSTLALP